MNRPSVFALVLCWELQIDGGELAGVSRLMNTMDDEMGSKESRSSKGQAGGMEFQLDSRFMPSTPNVYLSLTKRLNRGERTFPLLA